MPNKKKSNKVASARDMFQTPDYATDLIVPFLTKYKTIWECAAGAGKMAYRLEHHDFAVWKSDIIPNIETEKWNFITEEKDVDWMGSIDYIVTNPPFGHKIKFFKRCWKYWELYQIPFALLIPADYSGWVIDAVANKGCIKIIPTRRIDYITPTGLDARGGHTSNFHSLWLAKGLDMPTDLNFPTHQTEFFVELSLEAKKNI